MRNIIAFIVFLFVVTYGFSQDNNYLTSHYSFSHCPTAINGNNSFGVNEGTVTEAALVGSNNGGIDCGCGVRDSSIYLDGVDGYLNFPGYITSSGEANIFSAIDFSISFYMKPTSNSGIQDIMSKTASCANFNSFAVKYIGVSNTLVVELYEDPSYGTTLSVPLDEARCWYHVAIVRQGTKTRVYIDGELKQEVNAGDHRIDLNNNQMFTIANSPCLQVGGQNLQRYKGYIDELRFYSDALSKDEVKYLYYAPDRIVNEDQLLFIGDDIEIETTGSCALSYSWIPETGVSNPDIAEPTIYPEFPVTYILEFDHGDCLAKDSIKIEVVNADTIDCIKAFLPTAFTPNGAGPLKNETFGISNPFVLKDLISFEIFDRWGERVFFTSEVKERWDGTFKGDPLNSGAYVYRIVYHCNEDKRVDTGSFMLIR